MTNGAFDPLRVFAVLRDHRVRFVVIGGLAGRFWGSPSVTNDVDVCYACGAMNLKALAEALTELGARLRGIAEDVPFRLDARTLEAGDHFTFVTAAGNLDVLGHPTGTGGFDDLVKNAATMEIGGESVLVAALEDLIRMKVAAGRPKDRIEIEILEAVLEESDRERSEDAG